MTRNGILIDGDSLDHWNTHTIDDSNTVNGKPVRYWTNVIGGIVPSNAGQVILANCTGVGVQSQDVINGSAGIQLGFSQYNTVTGNNASGNEFGIRLKYSNNNTISESHVMSSSRFGIWLEYSDGNAIMGNTISSSGVSGILISHSTNNSVVSNTARLNEDGISLEDSALIRLTDNAIYDNEGRAIYGLNSNNNTIADNSISGNLKGINLQSSHEYTIAGNTISFSSSEGILLNSSTNNEIHHNNLIDNVEQGVDDTGENDWNDSYPSGGNYWHDYDDVDEKKGPNQDQDGYDNIGDTPYEISGGKSQDLYPLMFPVDIPSPPHLQAEAGFYRVLLRWNEPASDGGSPIASYVIYRGAISSSETFLAEVGNVLTYVDEGLTPGETYYYEVSARNAMGEGPRSNEANTTPLANQPPTCNITAPVSGTWISGTYTIEGTAFDSDGTVHKVEIRIGDGNWTQLAGTTSWSYDWNTTAIANGHTMVYARGYDGMDYSTVVSVTAVVNNTIEPPPSNDGDSDSQRAWAFGDIIWFVIVTTVVVAVVLLAFLAPKIRKRLKERKRP